MLKYNIIIIEKVVLSVPFNFTVKKTLLSDFVDSTTRLASTYPVSSGRE
jgi:hypothetical protein